MSGLPPPAKQRRADPLAGEREQEKLSPGAYFAQHKAMVDDRRGHLARLGMDARHVEALRMPDITEPPVPVEGAPAVQFVEGPASLSPIVAPAPALEEIPQAFSPKRPPRVEGVHGDLEES